MPEITESTKGVLTRKVGPLPVIGWAGVALGGFLVFRLATGRGSGGGSSTPFLAPVAADAGDAVDAVAGTNGTPPTPVAGGGATGAVGSNGGITRHADGTWWWCPPAGLLLACRQVAGPSGIYAPPITTGSTGTRSGASPTTSPAPVTAPVVPAPKPIIRYYTIQRGDTLTSIARRFSIAGGWAALYRLNRAIIGANPNLIRTGVRIRLN